MRIRRVSGGPLIRPADSGALSNELMSVRLSHAVLFSSLAVLDPRVGPRTYFLYLSLSSVSFWLTLPRRVLSTSWCCPTRPCVAFLASVHVALFLVLSLCHAPSSKPRILEQWLLWNTNEKTHADSPAGQTVQETARWGQSSGNTIRIVSC